MRDGLIHKLGFGASGAWAQPWFAHNRAVRLIHEAYEKGIRHFDTAGFYGRGQAELRLGEALRGCDDVVISTKVGTRVGNYGRLVKAFDPEEIRQDLETSLKRLKRESIDICYLHGPEDWVVSHSREIFRTLIEEGKIFRSGVCGEGEVLNKAVSEKKTDAIMGRFHAFDQRHQEVFENARANSIETVAIAPLAQALYRQGLYRPRGVADAWSLARALLRNRQNLGHIRPMRAQLAKLSAPLDPVQGMLMFALSQPFVDRAFVNTTRSVHLKSLCEGASDGALSDEKLRALAHLDGGLNAA